MRCNYTHTAGDAARLLFPRLSLAGVKAKDASDKLKGEIEVFRSFRHENI
jgi:hypothetical protein